MRTYENPTQITFPRYARMPDRSAAAMIRWEAGQIAEALGHRLAPWVPDVEDDFRVGLLSAATHCRDCGAIVAYDLTNDDPDEDRVAPALVGRLMHEECRSNVQTV